MWALKMGKIFQNITEADRREGKKRKITKRRTEPANFQSISNGDNSNAFQII